MTPELVALGLTAGAHAVLGLTVWRKHPGGPANRRFALLSGTLAAWTLSNGLVYSCAATPWGIVWARTAFAAASLIPLAFFLFVSAFPAPAPPAPRVMHPALAAAALLFLGLSATPLIAERTAAVQGALQVVYGPLHRLFGAYVVAALGWSLAFLARKLRGVTGIDRLRVRYVLLGTAIAGVAGTTTNLLVPLFAGSSRFSPYGPVFSLAMVLLIAHAIVRHRLMNIRVAVRRGLTEAVSFGVAAAVLVVLVWGLSALLEPQPTALPLWVALGLLLLTAQLFQPLRRLTQASLDRYCFRDAYDYAQVVRDATRQLAGTVGAEALAGKLADGLAAALRPETILVYVRVSDGGGYRLVASRADQDREPIPVLAVSSALVRELSARRQPLLVDELADDAAGRAAAGELGRLGALCAAPVSGEQLLGVILLGPKRTGDPYFAEDLDLLATLAGQAAIALRNAQLYSQLVVAEAERRRAERLASIGALASGIAHEIKNPLVAIRTFAELFPERADDPDFRGEFAQVVLREIERIDHLVARLRGLVTAPVGALTAVDVRQPLEETLTLLRGELQRRGITPRTTWAAALPAIMADPAQLKQLFLNLLMNALEAMERGGELDVQVRLRHALAEPRLVVEISDTGPGIREELLGRVFEPFVTTKARGSGLGLSICRAIADAHRATIRAENRVSGGARVVVEFPVAPSPGAARLAPTGRQGDG